MRSLMILIGNAKITLYCCESATVYTYGGVAAEQRDSAYSLAVNMFAADHYKDDLIPVSRWSSGDRRSLSHVSNLTLLYILP